MVLPLQTDFEGQAKKLMEFVEQTDMLIVAGGDGTLQEVVTGLLRRPDQVQVTMDVWLCDVIREEKHAYSSGSVRGHS